MDSRRFDALTKHLGAALTRRGSLGAILAGFVAVLPGSGSPNLDAAARRRRGSGSRKRKGAEGRDKKRGGTKRARRSKNGNGRTKRDAVAEAARCCSTGNCTPGKGKNLQKCCYQGQNLTGKNFTGANLGEANFAGAALTRANFSGANLGKACLVDADLRGVNFNSSTNLAGVIYCRTRTDSGENNSGCEKGMACCPTCDAAHPCADDEVCCNGRCLAGNCCDNGEQSTCDDGQICCANTCVDGDCCQATDCSNEICQRRACAANQCEYEPVFGEPGPRCQTICCENAQGDPVCCDAGVTNCQASGICGCADGSDCGANERCCAGTCVPRTQCCDGDNAEGCAGDLHCCVIAGAGVCRACCDADQCPDETCETKSCGADGTCAYTPVFGEDGPDCGTVCCRDASGEPDCCDAGITVCTANGRCRCTGDEDCTADQFCCNGTCIANTQCCDGNPSTCPAPGACQVRACASGACQPRGVSGGSCPISGGGTGVCRDGACVCPSPRITCNNVCCIEGVTQCAPDGTCPRLCDVCPSGCPFTTVAAAVAGTPAGGTIRICPGTYATLDVRIDKDLTIIGAGSGAGGTILDGQLTNRIFTVSGAPGSVVTVAIRDLSVTRGRQPQQANTGAGINVLFDAALTLERVEVTDNAVPSGFGLGPIAVAPRSSLLLKESRVANNQNFSFGGGINVNNDATVTLEASRIDGNSAGFGGGIWINDRGTVNLDDDSIVTENHAQNPSRGAGGGIFNKGRVNGATTSNITGNTRGNPPVPDNCANARRIPGSGFGTGCPA